MPLNVWWMLNDATLLLSDLKSGSIQFSLEFLYNCLKSGWFWVSTDDLAGMIDNGMVMHLYQGSGIFLIAIECHYFFYIILFLGSFFLENDNSISIILVINSFLVVYSFRYLSLVRLAIQYVFGSVWSILILNYWRALFLGSYKLKLIKFIGGFSCLIF